MKQFIKKVVAWLDGKKTYIVGIGTIIYAFGINRGYWHSDPDIWGTLFGGSAITLRLAVAKVAKQAFDDTLK